jgi:hypothetical protein
VFEKKGSNTIQSNQNMEVTKQNRTLVNIINSNQPLVNIINSTGG